MKKLIVIIGCIIVFLFTCVGHTKTFAGGRGRHAGPVETNPGTVIVAASDAPNSWRRGADYVCDGVSDEVEIQAAMDKIADAGNTGIVRLVGRDFNISSAIGMRDRVSLEAMESSVGSTLTIANSSNCNGIEIGFREGEGNANIRGIYINGNKANQTGGSGFVMPYYGLRVRQDGTGGGTTATVEVTSTQIIFKRDGAADYTITLDDSPGTMISEIINVVHGNLGWEVTNITGGLTGSKDTVDCTTTPADALAVLAEESADETNVDLVLGITYDYFFIKCMSINADDYGWYTPAGHSIHFDRCVAEFADVDGFYIVGNIDGVRMYGCYGAFNTGNGFTIDCVFPILTGCRARRNDAFGFDLQDRAAILTGCNTSENDEASGAGFNLATATTDIVLTGCRSTDDEVGIQIAGNYNTITGCSVIVADGYGISLTVNANWNVVTGNITRTNADFGIYCAGTDNVISGNQNIVNKSGGQQCIDVGVNNVWTGNSEECYFVERQADCTLTIRGTNSNAIYQSAHATNPVTFQLPAAILGMTYPFAVGVDGNECRVEPNGSETIAIGGAQSTAGSYITANAINETITLTCIVPGQWEDSNKGGTWTVQP